MRMGPQVPATPAGERSPEQLQPLYIQQDVRGGLVSSPFRLRQRGSSKRGSSLSVQAGECSSA